MPFRTVGPADPSEPPASGTVRPPLGVWLGYVLLDRRIPAVYRAWARRDIEGFWFPIRRWAQLSLLPLALMAALLLAIWPQLGSHLWPLFSSAVASGFAVRRHPARVRHLVPGKGEQPRAGDLVEQNAPNPRLLARSALWPAVPLLVFVIAASIVAVLFAPQSMHLVGSGPQNGSTVVAGPVGGARVGIALGLAVALALGVLAAALARRRFGRPSMHVNQPHRVLREFPARGKMIMLVAAAAVAVLTWSEVALGVAVEPAVAFGGAALLLLPGVLVAQEVTSRPEGAKFSVGDAWWIAISGLKPSVGPPIQVLRPFSSP